MNDSDFENPLQQEISINKENIIYSFKEDDSLNNSILSFDENLVIILSEVKGEIQLTFKIRIRNLEDKFTNLSPIEFEFQIKKDLNYFLNLHESFVLFQRNLNNVYLKIKEKLDKKSFSVTLNLDTATIKYLEKLILADDFQNSSQVLFNIDNQHLSGFIVLDLFFNLDEEKIILQIPLDNLTRVGNNGINVKIKSLSEKNEDNRADKFFLRLSDSKTVREAKESDIPLILSFIKKLAEFEKLLHEVTATEEVLKQNLFGGKAYSEVLIYEVNSAPVAFALFFNNFSTFKGKPGLYLEDIYVQPEFRNQRIGSDFFNILAKIAIERDCGRLEWSVLNWNEKAIQFYRKMGAYPMSEWCVYRMDRESIRKLADEYLL